MKNESKNENKNILGNVSLDTGLKPIILLNDVFINYTFMDKANWETLRNKVNILYKAYTKEHPTTSITTIEGKINNIITQFPYYKDKDSKTPKRQDAKIDSEYKIDYIEMQNDPSPELSIAERSLSQNSDNVRYPSNYIIQEVIEKPIRSVALMKITRIINENLEKEMWYKSSIYLFIKRSILFSIRIFIPKVFINHFVISRCVHQS